MSDESARADFAAPTARDKLALIRTELANERTLLAYLRTGLALVVGAITARQLVDDPMIRTMGLAIGVLGGIALAGGMLRFVHTRRRLHASMEGDA